MEARYVLWLGVFLTAAILDISKASSHEIQPRKDDNEKTRKTYWIHSLKNIPHNGDLLDDLTKKTVQEKSRSVGDVPKNKWIKFKESILRRNGLPDVQFVKISRNDFIEARRSYAVLQPRQPQGSVHTTILSMAAVVMFVVILVICIHAPCTCLWRRRHRSELEVDLISCPNPTAHDGKCGKCLYDKVSRKSASSSKFGFSKSKRPFSSPASIATVTNEELYMPCDSQSPWVSNSNKGNSATLPNPKKSRSIIQAILKRSRDRDKFRYEFLASRYGYNYKQFRDSYKRSSIYDEQDPNWYSPGEFLNNQSSYRGQKNYGSTDAGKHRGTTTCCQWSRGQQPSTNQSVEDIIKLQPRRRQIVELQEFPVGYSGTYVGEGNVKENILFDPLHDAPPCCHGSGAGGRMNSESNIDLYFSQADNNNHMASNQSEHVYPKANSPSTSPRTSTNIVQSFPVQFDYNDSKFVQEDEKHGEKVQKKPGRGKNKDVDDDDSDLYETSDDDLLSFDEWDAALERRQRRSQEFLYSPHMQGDKLQCHHLNHSYPAVLRYPDIPRDTRSLPREYKNRMRRNVTRSETELRRHSGYYGQSPVYHGYPRSTSYHSSSDTSLHRMQIEKELTAAGLNKQKKKKDPPVTIRDNRLDPLAGIMSPMRPLSETNKQTKNDTEQTKKKHWYHSSEDKQSTVANTECKSRAQWEPDLKVCLKDDCSSYVVKLPSLDCKESVLLEQSEEEGSPRKEYKYRLEKELNNEKPGSNYNRAHLEMDPHYIKNSYLREEPVRDTDSDDGERTRSTEITTGKTSINKDDSFSSNRSTRL